MSDDHDKVSSELYEENDFSTTIQPTINADNIVSKFPYTDIPESPKHDADGDLLVKRRKDAENFIQIEHSTRTRLDLVGLQVWRGALLLADWLISNYRKIPDDTYVLELGSGVGLTSIVASLFAPVICTDVNLGGILKLIENNIKRNSNVVRHPVRVLELDFTKDFSQDILSVLPKVSLIIAADVVYDDRITDAFVKTLGKLLRVQNRCDIYVALEKRFVFTVADCDTCAPCYEYFMDALNTLPDIRIDAIPIDFTQYFRYERVKELVLWHIHGQTT